MNWSTMTAHSRSHITKETIDIPSEVDWNRGLMHHTIVNGLHRQEYAPQEAVPRSPRMRTDTRNTGWDRYDMGGWNQYTRWDEYVVGRGTQYST
jgi:hypothetical protein